MDRRLFIKGLAGIAILSGLGGVARLMLGSHEQSADSSELLKEQLMGLASSRFDEYARDQKMQVLLSSLSAKGVISLEDGVRPERLATIAQQEPSLVYQGFYYTETELDLYALALLVQQDPALVLAANPTQLLDSRH